MSTSTEIILMWAAVTLYAVAAIAYVIAFVFSKPRVAAAAQWVVLAGIGFHSAGIIARWMRVGHGPYLGFYEVLSSYALFGVIAFLVLAWRKPGLRVLGIILLPAAFLALGAAMLASKSEVAITPTLASYWLTIHVTLAKLSYGSFITAAGIATLYLVRSSSNKDRAAKAGPASLTPEILDDLVFKFLAAGFIFLAMMIVAGAIWANEAWGRYWGWDPIETWSLVSWIAYAFVIHLRLTMGWRGKRFAWAALAALPVLLFALVGVAIVYQSIHGAYLTGA